MTEYSAVFETSRASHGFGSNWFLVVTKSENSESEIPEEKLVGSHTRRFWLGQDAKVAVRVFGIRLDALSRMAVNACQTNEFNSPEIQAWLLARYLEAVDTELEIIYEKAQDWDLSVE